jgi:hypothetical protein
VSSHTGIDDLTPGTIGEYVEPSGVSWTAAQYNSVAVQTELCGFAAWTAADWAAHPTMLANCAAWIAEEAARYGIPLVKLDAAQAQGGAAGVCGHADLGAGGGGHWDPGPDFPWGQVMAMAAGGGTSTQTEEGSMVLEDPTTGGYWVVADPLGSVHTYDNAPYLGGTGTPAFNADRYPCVGIARFHDYRGEGYTIVLDWGDAGNGHSADGGDRFRRYRFPRDGSGIL